VGLGEEVGVSLDLASSLEGDGGFLVDGVLESVDVSDGFVVLVGQSGDDDVETLCFLDHIFMIYGLEMDDTIMKLNRG